ncbi:MAG: IS66 family transposase, partial [Bacteroidia bacterium]|nr:IS66 family transposase [Bacteroidia bacterium]
VCCMAHARRNFFDAQGNDKQRAEYFIGAIQPLYRLEQELKDNGATREVILQKRKEIADPILKDLHIWLKANLPQVLPKSTIGQAIGYALARWEKIMRYTKDAALLIDNNLIENQIRPVAVGRKNYLFCGSHESAQRAAIIYSLLGTCKLNNVNPFEWLDDVLKKLPARKANNIADLLPQNWKPNSQDVV